MMKNNQIGLTVDQTVVPHRAISFLTTSRITTLLICAFGVPAISLHAAAIPNARLAPWKAGVNVGIPGGIPTNHTNIIDVTKSPYSADKTGAVDSGGEIERALYEAKSGDVVYLPAGRYRIDSRQVIPPGITLRGAGPETVLDMRMTQQAAIQASVGTEWPYDYSKGGASITGGLSQGSTTLNLSSTSGFYVGAIITISEENDLSVPVMDVSNQARLRKQKSEITAISGSTVTISPGLFWTMGSSRDPRAHVMSKRFEGCGIEDLKIDLTNTSAGYGIYFQQAVRCWIKNVTMVNLSNYGIYLANCFQSEIRHCDIRKRKTKGSNGAGIMVERSTGCLVEDNILYDIFPHIEVNFDASGNVFAYNFCEKNDVGDLMGVSIDSNHGAHNHFNLYEGNIASKFQADGYFGSASDDTVFRNWLHGTSDYVEQFGICVFLNRFTRNYNVVGNVLGRTGKSYIYDNAGLPTKYTDRFIYAFGLPNIGGGGAVGQAQLSQNRPWADWAAFLSGNSPGKAGFQEVDLDVEATTIRKGNWNAIHGGVPAAEALGSDVLPDSLFRASKPSWFGTLAWPAFGPSNPNQKYDAIPAGYRYMHGVDPVPDIAQSKAQAPTVVKIQRQTD